jgi:hypothetical protein
VLAVARGFDVACLAARLGTENVLSFSTTIVSAQAAELKLLASRTTLPFWDRPLAKFVRGATPLPASLALDQIDLCQFARGFRRRTCLAIMSVISTRA